MVISSVMQKPLDLKLTLTCRLAAVNASTRRRPAMNLAPLHDYRILITGGTSGLGGALVAELHARGARVAFVARHADAVERTARAHPGSHGITGDIARKDDVYPIAVQALGV